MNQQVKRVIGGKYGFRFRELQSAVTAAVRDGGKHHWVDGNHRRRVCGLSGDRVGDGMSELTAALATIEKCREISGCPAGVDLQDWVKRLAAERDEALNAERIWEKTMMEVCGEDGPASVASEIRSLQALRDTAMQALKSQVGQLAAENVALKAGASYFSYGSEHNFEWHKTAKEAVEAAETAIDDYRGDACDGWSEEVDSICWGIIMQSSTKVGERPRNEDDCCDPAIDTVCDYALLPNIPTPATDRIYAGIKADGVEDEPFGFVSRNGDVVVIELNGYRHIRDGMPVFVKELREGAK